MFSAIIILFFLQFVGKFKCKSISNLLFHQNLGKLANCFLSNVKLPPIEWITWKGPVKGPTSDERSVKRFDDLPSTTATHLTFEKKGISLK